MMEFIIYVLAAAICSLFFFYTQGGIDKIFNKIFNIKTAITISSDEIYLPLKLKESHRIVFKSHDIDVKNNISQIIDENKNLRFKINKLETETKALKEENEELESKLDFLFKQYTKMRLRLKSPQDVNDDLVGAFADEPFANWND